VRSINDRLCKTIGCSGNPLEPQLPSMFGKPAYGQEKDLEMVKMLMDWVIRSRNSKSALLGYEFYSEIGRWSVCYEGLSNLSTLKVRSGL